MKKKLKINCRYFKGERPCVFNKQNGIECSGCKKYSPYKEKILIIKLDAMGDVLRTTVILPKIKEKFPHSQITWITRTESCDLLKVNPYIDDVWKYDNETMNKLAVIKWDMAYNLSNDYSGSAILSFTRAKNKIGFFLSKKGIITPTNGAAYNWLEMASFDRKKKENKFSYQELMYKICGFKKPIEKPVLFLDKKINNWAESYVGKFLSKPKNIKIIGINTGCGGKWAKRMPSIFDIAKIIKILISRNKNYYIVLLGGIHEKEKNKKITALLKSKKVIDVGCDHGVLEFSAIIGRLNAIFCGDTLALHIASALNVPIVALFGPTSNNEIYDYNGLISKMHSNEIDCLCCYNNCEKKINCMNTILIKDVALKIENTVERYDKEKISKK